MSVTYAPRPVTEIGWNRVSEGLSPQGERPVWFLAARVAARLGHGLAIVTLLWRDSCQEQGP